MRGYFVKDLAILSKQKLLYLVAAGLGIFFGISNNDFSFFAMYITLISSSFVVTSLSYDMTDNGMGFILSMPGGYKKYLTEKYLLIFFMSAGSSLIGFVANMIGNHFMNSDTDMATMLIGSAGIFFICAAMMCVFIPIQLKLGPERMRLGIMIFGGVLAVCGAVLVKLGSSFGFDIDEVINNIIAYSTSNFAIVIAEFAVAVVLMFGLSYFISYFILRKKEF